MNRKICILAALLFVLFGTTSLFADMIFLKNGRVFVGRVTGQGLRTIRFTSDGRRKVYRKRSVRRIVYGDTIAQRAVLVQRKRREVDLQKKRARARRLEERRKKAAAELKILEEKRRKARAESERLAQIEKRRQAQEEAQRLLLAKARQKAQALANRLKNEKDRKKAEAELKRLAELEDKRLEETRVRLQKEAEERKVNLSHLIRLNEALAKARLTVKNIESQKKLTQENVEKILEQNDVVNSRFSYRTGRFYWDSGILRTASRLAFTDANNRLLSNGFSLYGVPDTGSAGVVPGETHEFEFYARSFRRSTATRHRITITRSRSDSYMVPEIGKVEESFPTVYSTSTERNLFNPQPRIAELEYFYTRESYPFSSKGGVLENFGVFWSLGLASGYSLSEDVYARTNTNFVSGTNPTSVNSLFAITPFRESLFKTEYGEGIAYAGFGIRHEYSFLDIHQVDASFSAYFGRGVGNFDSREKYVEPFLLDPAIPNIQTTKVQGSVRVSARRLQFETGYSVDLKGIRLRLFLFFRESITTVTESKIRTIGSAGKNGALLLYGLTGALDLKPIIVEGLDNLGPFPKSVDLKKGIGLEIGYKY